MTERHDELRESIGAYVLSQLEGELLADLEEHLTTCAECRAEAEDLASLAAPLRAVDPEVVAALARPAPESLDARVEAALRAEAVSASASLTEALPDASVTPFAPPSKSPSHSHRAARARRRWVPVAVGALAGAAAAAAVAVAVLPQGPPPGATVIAVDAVTTAPGVSATAGLVDHTWGVELRLVATGLPAGQAYDVRIVDDGGTAHDSGAFLGVDRTITCSMNASVLLAEAARFEVVDPGGTVVISGPIGA